jgi:hypothetical protein
MIRKRQQTPVVVLLRVGSSYEKERKVAALNGIETYVLVSRTAGKLFVFKNKM